MTLCSEEIKRNHTQTEGGFMKEEADRWRYSGEVWGALRAEGVVKGVVGAQSASRV